MAMSGTLTASTAGVSVPGGPTHPQEPGKGLQPQPQGLQQEASGLSSAQLCSAEASSGSLGASSARGGEAIQAPPSQGNPGHPAPTSQLAGEQQGTALRSTFWKHSPTQLCPISPEGSVCGGG